MPSLRALLQTVPAAFTGNPEVAIAGLAYDSRRVRPGDLFACLPGTKVHGQAFIPDVLRAGAAAVLVEDARVVPVGVTAAVVPDTREALAWVAAAFYGQPADALALVGVTGTNGKTTTVTVLRELLEAAGRPTGLIGTMAYRIGDEILKAPHTTPQAPDLQALLARMRDAGLTHAAMEVSSHALCQHRATGARFRAAAFTNLTQDHLDYHGTMEAYREAKTQLFADPRYPPRAGAMIGLFNADDPAADYLAARAVGPVRWYGLTRGDYRATDVALRADGTAFTFVHPGGALPAHMQLAGAFNVSNALAALGLAVELGVDPQQAVAALAGVPPVDGRVQRVPGSGGGKPTVLVDYAHTPDGLEKVLSSAQTTAPGRVVVVFGCGGNRDRTKRPQMAAIAARWARAVVVTSDNPRDEDPQAIIDDILAGFTAGDRDRVTVEPDRARAIQVAIQHAGPDDLVVLAGKGHEDYQIFANGETIHFDDREEASRALAAWSAA